MRARRAAHLPLLLERNISLQVRAALWPMGITLWRRNTGAVKATYKSKSRLVRFALEGQADLYGIGPGGRHWEIEVKRPGKKPTAKQFAWLRLCDQLGAVAFWTDSADLAARIAAAMLEGGRILWYDDGDYDVDLSSS